MQNTLAERSVLMRFTAGLPGQHRKDKRVTSEVQAEKGLGKDSGKWVKDLFPEVALKAVKSKINEARAYHDSVTLPFGCRGDDEDSTPAMAGVGILPAALIKEYADKMRQFKGELEVLADDFLRDPWQWVAWAQKEHNGTFDPKNYPGCTLDSAGAVQVDAAEWDKAMRKKFYLRTEPLPVPNAQHFTEAVTSLLGVDVESVDIRVRDAEQEARREVVRRLIAPVKAMAEKLSEAPKAGKDDIVFRDTLIGNVQDIVALAPKLNISGDPEIDAMVVEVEKLTRFSPAVLRDDKYTRNEAADLAAATLKRLSGYNL